MLSDGSADAEQQPLISTSIEIVDEPPNDVDKPSQASIDASSHRSSPMSGHPHMMGRGAAMAAMMGRGAPMAAMMGRGSAMMGRGMPPMMGTGMPPMMGRGMPPMMGRGMPPTSGGGHGHSHGGKPCHGHGGGSHGGAGGGHGHAHGGQAFVKRWGGPIGLVTMIASLLACYFNWYTVSRVCLHTAEYLTVSNIVPAAIFNIVVLLAVLGFLRTAFVDAGFVSRRLAVPASLPVAEQRERISKVAEELGITKVQVCEKCSNSESVQYRPLRAHHCQVCKRCVLRMDHHCLFANNCIGAKNYKSFYLFLWYSYLAAVLSLLVLVWTVFTRSKADYVGEWSRTLVHLDLAMMTLFMVFMHYMLRTQSFLASKNMTSIDYTQLSFQWAQKHHMGVESTQSGMFDYGFVENWKRVLGDNVWLWWWPLHAPSSDGSGYDYAYSKKAMEEIMAENQKVREVMEKKWRESGLTRGAMPTQATPGLTMGAMPNQAPPGQSDMV
eukprot:310613_1